MNTIPPNILINDFFSQFAEGYARFFEMKVFPLVPRTKKPLTKNGYKDASNEISTILEWWKQYPYANIGCATGLFSKVAVLDIDPKPNADLILYEFENKFRKLPDTPTAISGGGGYHFYFKINSVLPCRVKLIHGVDFRAEGGYIVLPPSIHENGTAYTWKPGFHVNDLPFAEIPEWLVNLVKNTSNADGSPRNGLFRNVTDDLIIEGVRTSTMTSTLR